MEIIKKEKLLEKSIGPIFIKTSELITNQMKKCIFKIYIDNIFKGTGFFTRIPFPDYFHLLPVLVTVSFVIDSNALKQDCIHISLNDDKELRKIKLKDTKRKIFKNNELNTTFIEILPEDKISDFLEVDENIFKENKIFKEIYYRKSIYVLHYMEGEKCAMNTGIIKNINCKDILHSCNTHMGSSGGPILLLDNLKIIGMHYGAVDKINVNKGIFLNFPIIEFQKQK